MDKFYYTNFIYYNNCNTFCNIYVKTLKTCTQQRKHIWATNELVTKINFPNNFDLDIDLTTQKEK